MHCGPRDSSLWTYCTCMNCGLAQLLYIKKLEKNTIDLLWMQTHCTMDDTVVIDCLHGG
jgi:hypothetical protein